MTPTPLSAHEFKGRKFFLKRDDLYNPFLSGNKFRKLHTLIQTPKSSLKRILSYGGTQSNAMVALAKLCHDKEWEFVYYTKKLSKTQKENPQGNYLHALGLGMKCVEVEHALYKECIASLPIGLDNATQLVHQGGAGLEAQAGMEALAMEIRTQLLEIPPIVLPSGTGTSAFFLAHALKECKVYTVPAVGDVAYLRLQMEALGDIPKNLYILEPKKKYPFAKPQKEFFTLWQELKTQTGVEFDLLYAPLMWQTLLEQTKEEFLYVHSGGVLGNDSMLTRYRAKKFC